MILLVGSFKSTSQGHSLPLPLRQVQTVVSKQVIQPVVQLVNQIVQAVVMYRLLNILPAWHQAAPERCYLRE